MGKGSRPRPFSVSQEEFGNRIEGIFGKKPPRAQYIPPPLPGEETMTPSVEQMKKGTCGCGRSPTGNCVGWHGLTEAQFVERKELYETGKVDLSGKDIK